MKELDWQELYKLLDYDTSTGVFRWRNPRRGMRNDGVAGTTSTRGIIKITIRGRQYKAHRLAWLYVFKQWPRHAIDHIDGNPSNNTLSNLRDVPQVVNNRNQRLSFRNTSGVCGVCWHRQGKKWKAEVSVNNRTRYLGLFDNLEDAAAARNEANKELGFHDNHGTPATVEWEE